MEETAETEHEKAVVFALTFIVAVIDGVILKGCKVFFLSGRGPYDPALQMAELGEGIMLDAHEPWRPEAKRAHNSRVKKKKKVGVPLDASPPLHTSSCQHGPSMMHPRSSLTSCSKRPS